MYTRKHTFVPRWLILSTAGLLGLFFTAVTIADESPSSAADTMAADTDAAKAATATASDDPVAVFEIPGPFTPVNEIDRVLSVYWEKNQIEPAALCSDAVFLRRVYVDVIGAIPTADEAKQFLDDTNPDKRAVLIDTLLDRPEFSDYWTMKWCDLLRVKSEFPINLWPHGAATYYRWIHHSLRTNKPYDRFARELLLGQGSNFRDGPANFYRAVERKQPDALAEAAALTFMGTRTDRWPDQQRNNLIALFSRISYKATAQWKEEIVYVDRKPLESPNVTLPDGTTKSVAPGLDPRELFVQWLIRPDNQAFNHNIVNRIWFWLTGQGIVNPPDDFRPDNPPVCPELLDAMAGELVRANYDLKAVYRLILNSRTYQLSSRLPSQASSSDRQKAVDALAVYPVRRIEAEVLQDMLISIFELKITYVSEVPEPFAYLPDRMRTILLQDSGITNSFLELFGRATRDSGMLADRNNDVNESQQLFMMNSNDINSWTDKFSQRMIKERNGKPNEAAYNRRMNNQCERFWLTILSRRPTDAERELFKTSYRSQDIRDIAWCLINTREFICRH